MFFTFLKVFVSFLFSLFVAIALVLSPALYFVGYDYFNSSGKFCWANLFPKRSHFEKQPLHTYVCGSSNKLIGLPLEESQVDGFYPSVRVSCGEFNEDSVSNGLAELKNYLAIGQRFPVFAPWDPGYQTDEKTRLVHRKARMSYADAISVYEDLMMTQEARDRYRKFDTDLPSPELEPEAYVKAADSFYREFDSWLQERARPALEKMAADSAYDQEIVSYFLKDFSYYNWDFSETPAAILRMGTGPRDTDLPYSASGYVSLRSNALEYGMIEFAEIETALPAFLEYLCKVNCLSPKYEIVFFE